MSKLLVANWKMNPTSENEAIRLAKAIDKEGIAIAPPFIFLPALKKVLKNASLGAQDAFWEEKGAFTGEVSPPMLKKLGVEYVIIGHSERRALGETDAIINKKVLAALKAGLKLILCVGEDLKIRRRGLKAVKNFIKNQLQKDLPAKIFKKNLGGLIVAYEPIWAIGAGKADTPEDAKEIINFIKKILHSNFYFLNSKVLYGGSVNAQNAAGFLKVADGLLVGGASLRVKEFLSILRSSA